MPWADLKIIAAVGGPIVAAGFTVGLYSSTLASKPDLEAVEHRVTVLEQHDAATDAKLNDIKLTLHEMRLEQRYTTEMLIGIARQVGASIGKKDVK